MNDNRTYILVNKDLNMSTGKIAAQVAHAVSRMPATKNGTVSDTVIVLQATGEQIKNLERYLDERDIHTSLYIDEGVNEVPPYSVTAMAVQPLNFDEDDYDLRHVFEGFELLGARGRRWLR